jgi:hypothetical protein
MTERGQRKVRHAREQSLLLLCGFLVASWMKSPTELFVAFVVGVTGLSGAFVWGNAQEHRAKPNSVNSVPEAPATPAK